MIYSTNSKRQGGDTKCLRTPGKNKTSHTRRFLVLNHTKNTQFLKQAAKKLGFSFCGIAKAEKLDKEGNQLETWLNKGYHGKMGYMENHFEKRIDPRELVPGAKSVICLVYNYYPETELPSQNHKIARYAYGEDYHHVIKDKLSELVIGLSPELGSFEGRGIY